MPDPLRTTVAQFSSFGGQWQPRAANTRAVEPAADLPGAQRGSLYMLAEASGTGGGHSALYRQMLNAAQTAFYEAGDSVEAALRQAVRNAHTVLRRANEGLPEAEWRAGMTLVVRQGNRLIIAQAGPALVLIGHPRTIDQFPAELGAWGLPLGGEERPQVQIYETAIESGSMLLIAQSDWPAHVAPRDLAVAAAAPNPTLACQYLGELAGDAELTALLVGFAHEILELRDEPQAPLASVTEGQGQDDEPSLEGAGRVTAKVLLASAASKVLGRGRGSEDQAAGDGGVAADTAPFDGAAAPAGPAGVIPDVAAPFVPVPRSPASDVEALREHVAEPSEVDAAQRMDGDAVAAPGEPRSRNPWWLLIALVVIPLLIVGIIVAMVFGRSRAAEAQYQQKLEGATNIIVQAEAMTDDAAALQHLGGARDFLDQARALRPDDDRLAPIQARYDAIRAQFEHVVPLYGIVPLWSFKDVGQQLERVVVSGDAVFVLDSGRMAVHRFTRSTLGDSVLPAEKALIQKGDQVSGQVVGDLVDMTWVSASDAGQRSKLLVLETSGGLTGYDVTWGAERLALGGQAMRVQPQFIVGYGGNLYVADPGADQIWRYRPSGAGYGDPEPYFPEGVQVDLAGLRSMAIDGNVWLLFDDGRLLKFFSGEQRSFVWQGLPDTLSAPAAVVVPIDGDRLYLADPGNGRIIDATKDGRFTRQFRAREGDLLRDLKGFFLDEAGAMLYVLTDDELYKVDIPAASATPAASPTPTAAS